MQVQEVRSEFQKRQFQQLPFFIYRHDQNWISPLINEIENIFNAKHNKYLNDGDAVRFILLDQSNKPVGRIAAFYRKQNLKGELKTGGIGFFECINDQQAANKLFDACKDWLVEKGCNVIDGPVNFGERDKWWGLLVDGFDPPVYGLNYHLPYYRQLFEAWGFRNYFEQYTFTIQRHAPLPQIIERIYGRLLKRKEINFRTVEKNKLEKYAEDFRTIYNLAWAQHGDVQPISAEQSRQILKETKPVMDPSLMVFAYVNEQPAGFFIAIPDANQLLKYAHGNLNLWGKLNILLHKPFVKMHNVYGIIFGVAPQYQRRGLEAGLAAVMHEMLNKSRYYEQLELLWIGDFNKKMLNFVDHIHAKKYRTLITYRIILNESIPFERCPVIE